MAFLDKVKNLLAKNADKVDTAIDKAGDMVDKKTQGKYAQHVDKAQDAARNYVNKDNPLPRAPAAAAERTAAAAAATPAAPPTQ